MTCMNPTVFALRHLIKLREPIVPAVGGPVLAVVRMTLDIFPGLNVPVLYLGLPHESTYLPQRLRRPRLRGTRGRYRESGRPRAAERLPPFRGRVGRGDRQGKGHYPGGKRRDQWRGGERTRQRGGRGQYQGIGKNPGATRD